jgi:hypothetical protein
MILHKHTNYMKQLYNDEVLPHNLTGENSPKLFMCGFGG